ncbi:MAG: UDP-glucose--hexose-1-phosphate uridylyltransferase [Chloroflexi bacterium]|nr:UDP-glucose--hexose-1-phosphate uridylyltransferase [Chloroflexota bacterium]
MFNPNDHPHRRYNPLTDEWMLVSPHRAKRPWQGQVEDTPPDTRPQYDPGCYLCPGNTRASGITNPQFEQTFVFDNDFMALLPDTPNDEVSDHPLFRMQGERGLCRVICFSPRHDLTLAHMPPADIRPVVDTWAEQTLDLGARDFIGYVQVFENKGAMMGCSNPHPHGQIWSTERLPREVEKELCAQREYFGAHGVTLLADYLAEEQRRAERIVYANEHWTVLVPFWAVWPFETMVVANRPTPSIPALDDPQRDALADALHHLTVRYDNLFRTSFPYSMGFHQQPTDGGEHPYWHLHAHFYPPLLRSATVRKFMVGYEMLGTPQRDITAEQAAARLRGLGAVHYTKNTKE